MEDLGPAGETENSEATPTLALRGICGLSDFGSKLGPLARIVQWTEQHSSKVTVEGSNPSVGAMKTECKHYKVTVDKQHLYCHDCGKYEEAPKTWLGKLLVACPTLEWFKPGSNDCP